MCGRYTYKLTWEEIVALYRLTLDQTPRNIQPRYNVCPTTDVDVVVSNDGKRSVVPMRWGLIAAWWNKPLKELKLATFNARAESIATKLLHAGRRATAHVRGHPRHVDQSGNEREIAIRIDGDYRAEQVCRRGARPHAGDPGSQRL